MRLARRSLLALLATASMLTTAVPALGASSPNPVIADCLAHPGGLTGHYTVAQLKHALQVMPAETKEYTSCPDVINRALLAAVGTSGTGTASSGGSSSFLPTPVIVILVVLILAAVTFGALAVRRRQAESDGGAPAAGASPSDPAGASPSDPADDDLAGPR